MTIQDWGAIGEAIGGIAIIISLIYVGLQIKQNTNALKLSTAHNTAEDFSATYLVLAEGENLAGIFFRGLQNIDELDPVERLRFFAYFHKFFRAYENAYYQFQHGALESEAFEGLTQQLVMIKTLPGVQSYWQERKSWYNNNFQEYVDQEIMPLDVDNFILSGT